MQGLRSASEDALRLTDHPYLGLPFADVFCWSVKGGLTVPAYAAAKGALGQLTKALSNEWSTENVQVNGIVPGYIATDMYVSAQSQPNSWCNLIRTTALT